MIRLALANWLAYYELPPDRRPAPDPNVSGRFDFYAFGSEAPERPARLSAALDHWVETAADAPDLLAQFEHRRLRFGELTGHRALVVTLASEVYKRDHGAYPKTDEALVGPYLKRVPDDGTGGLPAADGL